MYDPNRLLLSENNTTPSQQPTENKSNRLTSLLRNTNPSSTTTSTTSQFSSFVPNISAIKRREESKQQEKTSTTTNNNPNALSDLIQASTSNRRTDSKFKPNLQNAKRGERTAGKPMNSNRFTPITSSSSSGGGSGLAPPGSTATFKSSSNDLEDDEEDEKDDSKLDEESKILLKKNRKQMDENLFEGSKIPPIVIPHSFLQDISTTNEEDEQIKATQNIFKYNIERLMSTDELFFVQLPSALPFKKSVASNTKTTPQQQQQHDEESSIWTQPFESTLPKLPSGYIGEMIVRKSGKTTLKLGDDTKLCMDVVPGTDFSFLEHVAVIAENKNLFLLGEVAKRLSCVPDIESMIMDQK